MPEISRFYGIVIQMYYGDHLPPHFHVTYNGQTAKFEINGLRWIEGQLPPRARDLVQEWANLHKTELQEAFRKVIAMEMPGKIEPLP